ncbi:alpha mannosidase-like protein, partial [Ascosphaera atra]
MSSIPSRPDYFHAASLVHLDLMYTAPEWEAPPAVKRARKQINTSHSDSPQSPSNYTFYPWTLPPQKVLPDATCATMALRPTLDLSFPPLTGTLFSGASMERVKDGILAKSLSGLRLGMIQDVPIFTDLVEGTPHAYRIQVINNVPLGRDERVYISRKATALLNPNDANFAQIADLDVFDLVIDLDPDWVRPSAHPFINLVNRNLAKPKQSGFGLENLQEGLDQGSMKMAFSSFVNHVASLLRDEVGLDEDAAHDSVVRIAVPAMTAVGKGAAGPLTVEDATMRPLYASTAGK